LLSFALGPGIAKRLDEELGRHNRDFQNNGIEYSFFLLSNHRRTGEIVPLVQLFTAGQYFYVKLLHPIVVLEDDDIGESDFPDLRVPPPPSNMVATSPVVNGTPHSSEEPKPNKVRRSGT
jgi:hypothetical protein